jgi:hypothetical protein
MADLYVASGEVGTLTGAGSPYKVYADATVAVTTGDTIVIPGATGIVSCTVTPASSTATVTTSGGTATIGIGTGTPICQVLIIYY